MVDQTEAERIRAALAPLTYELEGMEPCDFGRASAELGPLRARLNWLEEGEGMLS